MRQVNKERQGRGREEQQEKCFQKPKNRHQNVCRQDRQGERKKAEEKDKIKEKKVRTTLQVNKMEVLGLNHPFLHLLFLLLSGARLELHSSTSLSIPVTPGNTVP